MSKEKQGKYAANDFMTKVILNKIKKGTLVCKQIAKE